MQKIAIAFHEKYGQYDLGEEHPFRGDRFRNAIAYFKKQGLFDCSQIELVTPQPAMDEDLLRVHTVEYVDQIQRLARENKAYDMETPVSTTILEAALLIMGGAIECGKRVIENKAAQAISIGGGYHHAGRNYGGGFCLFNDTAILIEHLRANHNVKRFLNLDYDVHFGNGTSDIYYNDPSVLYISLHQDPRTIYPGTGFAWQIGKDKGEGYNVNVPLPPRTGDQTYLYALNEVFVPLAEEFKPDIIIANGGSDSHFADSLGQLGLTTKGFFRVSSLVKQVAKKVCNGRLILIPGSGYNPLVLPQCWHALIAGIIDTEEPDLQESAPPEPSDCRRTVEKTLDELKRRLRKYWSSFDGFSISGIA